MMKRFLPLVLLLFCSGLFAQAQPDLELSFSAVDPDPDVYTTFVVELHVTNAGDEISQTADIDYVLPNTIRAVGQGEGFATQGTFLPHELSWEVGQLAPGESATLYLNLFSLSGSAKRVYAQVVAQQPEEFDSTPNNGTPPVVNEDDEAVFVLNDDNTPICDIDIQVISSVCDDQQTADPADDTYDVSVELLYTNSDAATISIAGIDSVLSVGERIELDDLLISDGAFSIMAQDTGLTTCEIQRTVVPPLSCSNNPLGSCANNLLENGGFEDNQFYPQGWRSATSFNYELVPDAYEGSQALSLSGESFTQMYQNVAGVPGETYNFSMQVSKSLYIIQASVQIKFLSDTWQVLGRELQSLNDIPYSTSYQAVNLSAVAPPNTKYVELRIERYDGDGDLRLDALCLTGATIDACANDNVPPTIEFCPQDIVVFTTGGQTSAPAIWVAPISRDNCTETSDLVFGSSHQPGDIFDLGNTTVTSTVMDESGNTNTCSFIVRVLEPSGGESDLSITRMLPIYSVRPATTVSLGFTLSNAGDLSVPTGVLATAYLSEDPVLDSGDIPVGQMSLAGTPLGRTDLRMDYMLPTSTVYGAYFIIVKVDDTEALVETDETNNVRSVPIDVRASCFGQSRFPWHEWISNVTFDGYVQASGKSQFTSYADQPYAFSAGQEVVYSFETTFSYVTSTPHYSVYIDINQDGLLNPDELWFEVAGTQPASAAGAVSTTSGTATLPAGLADGIHAVRVIMSRDEFISFSCGGIDFGEIEEYAFDISNSTVQPLVRQLRQSENMLSASPNPVKYDFVRLRAPKLVDQPVEVRIVDGFGRTLFNAHREHIAAESMEMELPELPQGLYQIVVVPQKGQLLSAGVVVE